MHTGIGDAGVCRRWVRIVAVCVRGAAVTESIVWLVHASTFGVAWVRELTKIHGTRVVVIALGGLRTAASLSRTEAAVGFSVYEVFEAHVEHARISGLAVFVLVTAEWVIDRFVSTCVLSDVTVVGRTPVIIVTIFVGHTAARGRLVYTVVGRVTAVDGAGIPIVAHAVGRTLFTSVV